MFNLAPVPVPDLTGRTVLVTGAGKGIGAELVRILVANGAKVFAGVFSGESVGRPACGGDRAGAGCDQTGGCRCGDVRGLRPNRGGWMCW